MSSSTGGGKMAHGSMVLSTGSLSSNTMRRPSTARHGRCGQHERAGFSLYRAPRASNGMHNVTVGDTTLDDHYEVVKRLVKVSRRAPLSRVHRPPCVAELLSKALAVGDVTLVLQKHHATLNNLLSALKQLQDSGRLKANDDYTHLCKVQLCVEKLNKFGASRRGIRECAQRTRTTFFRLC